MAMHSRVPALLAAATTTLAGLCAPGWCLAQGNDSASALRFIGEAIMPTGLDYAGTEVGGLSGLDFDRRRGVYYAISDDRSSINPARFYTLTIDLADGGLENDDVEFIDITTMLDVDGAPFAPSGVDPEAIRYDPSTQSLYWTSEGDANQLQAPFVRQMNLDGSFVRELVTPVKYFPGTDGSTGIRNNLAFESLTFSSRRGLLVTATENALAQDGPAASVDDGSPVRILTLAVATGEPVSEFMYQTDPVAADSVPSGEFTTNGLVELLALSQNRFLAVERSFSVGVGNAIRVYLVNTRRADDVAALDSIADQTVTFASKRLLLDLADLGIVLDNIEGVTFGPRLPGGERSLILVSDNNFNDTQFTQFLAFAIELGDAGDD
ncbi:MAG: esterase-like activity of phytase family protein [Pseudomonadota bacterium]